MSCCDPIRILHIVTYMGRGGIETMLMNYYRNIDREKVQFDFLVHRDFEADYDKEIIELGGKIYRLPRLNPFGKEYLNALDTFFSEHIEYKIVHSHLDCMAGIPLKYAKKHGVPIRIAHAHNSNQTKDVKYVLKLIYKNRIPVYANRFFACGKKAGEWMYGNRKFHILNNAIDSGSYSYNPAVRGAFRKEMGIPEDAFVVGHVGLFRPQKNHELLLDIFKKIHDTNGNSFLLLVGDGELKNRIQQKVHDYELSDSVIFLGIRNDVSHVLQAMDVFLFPSFYEGFSLAIIEAQAAGLPCFISDRIPIECKITDLVEQLHLQDSPALWAECILKKSNMSRQNTHDTIVKKGFDIVSNAQKLQRYYEVCYRKHYERGINNQKQFRSDIKLTVFTPTYNRAHTLPRTYESLKKQKCKDFLWLIVDDGSTDNTRDLVKTWQESEIDFEIQYIYKTNGGMHTAHNVAYENINTELNVCIDSDDCLGDNAIELILEKWKEVEKLGYAGIIGLDADLNNQLIGKGFPPEMRETTLGGYYAGGGLGDKKLVYRTDIITDYPPYPIFDGEKYVALAFKYRLIDQNYKLAVLDEILCNVEYQDDGSSGTMWKQYLNNPKGFAFWRKVCMEFPVSYKRLVIDCIHYVSSSIIAKNPYYIFESPKKLLTILVSPFGLVLTIIIRIRAKS